MKQYFGLIFLAVAYLGLSSCEQHDWDKETKHLYKHSEHAVHDAHHEAATGGHAQPEQHAEQPATHH